MGTIACSLSANPSTWECESIIKSWEQGAAVEFDHFGLRANQAGDLLIGTDRGDVICGDRDGLGDAVLIVDGNYFSRRVEPDLRKAIVALREAEQSATRQRLRQHFPHRRPITAFHRY